MGSGAGSGQPPPDGRRCTARSKRSGERCRKWALVGLDVCTTHGGRTPVAQAKSARAKAARTLGLYGSGSRLEVDPAEALVGELHRTAAVVAWLEDKLGREDGEAALVEWTEKQGRKASAWVEMYEAERGHLVKVAKAAIDAGIAERQVQLAEQQGKLVADAIRAILDDLRLDEEQQRRAPQVVRRHLTALPAGA